MPQAQPPLLLAQRHYNHQLFADRYLDVTLPGRTAWRWLLDEARPVLDRIQSIFGGYTPSTNEAQTEHELGRWLAQLVNTACNAPFVDPLPCHY